MGFSPDDDNTAVAEHQNCETEPQCRPGSSSAHWRDFGISDGRAKDSPTGERQKAQRVGGRYDMTSKGTIEKDQKLKELQEKCDMTSEDVMKKDQDAVKFRKLWKKAATEHDKFRASGQGFYQVTDEYLVELINHLRLAIRDFSIQYFDGQSLKRSKFSGYMKYLRSPTKSPEVIQAFLWRVVVDEVFQKFEWLGTETSRYFLRLRDLLEYPLYANTQGGPSLPNHEAERKFHCWNSNTISLLLASVDLGKAENDLKCRTHSHVTRITNTVDELLHKDSKRSFRDQLSGIITQAFALDKEISRQVARVIWRFNTQQEEKGRDTHDPSKAGLVISPAVFKRESSNK
ncbi:hypothetical protein FBEOM_7082 [Fusarium beomiforme]|uniref:Uncharacterized protein n=1 Tax=Fusarium beomiforme TaxID=44412 RepID=A0A9P5DXE9_9HYPO|nr:hypothetical protein FBEOM_7082 [Fusarium beomiforme]